MRTSGLAGLPNRAESECCQNSDGGSQSLQDLPGRLGRQHNPLKINTNHALIWSGFSLNFKFKLYVKSAERQFSPNCSGSVVDLMTA